MQCVYTSQCRETETTYYNLQHKYLNLLLDLPRSLSTRRASKSFCPSTAGFAGSRPTPGFPASRHLSQVLKAPQVNQKIPPSVKDFLASKVFRHGFGEDLGRMFMNVHVHLKCRSSHSNKLQCQTTTNKNSTAYHSRRTLLPLSSLAEVVLCAALPQGLPRGPHLSRQQKD